MLEHYDIMPATSIHCFILIHYDHHVNVLAICLLHQMWFMTKCGLKLIYDNIYICSLSGKRTQRWMTIWY